MGHFVHLIVRLTATAVAIAIVLLALLSMRLAAGPLSLSALAPSLARLLEGITPYKYEIGDVWVLWRDWKHGLLVGIDDARIIGDENDTHADIDDLTVGFSATAMAQGVIAPTFIEVASSDIRVDRRELAAAPNDAGDGGLEDLLKGLRGPPDASHPLSFLQAVNLSKVSISLQESRGDAAASGSDWQLIVSQAEFSRDSARRLTGSAAMTLELGEEHADVAIVLAPSAQGGLQVDLTVANLRPAAFAPLDPSLATLALLDVPLRGSGHIEIGDGGDLNSAMVDVTGNGGALALDDTLARSAGLAVPPQRLNVQTLAFRASFDAAHNRLAVETLEIAFASSTVLHVPAPVDHRFPLAGLTATGVYEDGSLSISAFNLNLDPLRLAMTATAEDLVTAPSGHISVSADDVRVDDFTRYWPRTLAPGAWEWCTTRLRDGVVPRLDAQLAFRTSGDSTEVTGVDARFRVERLTVDYLPPMPPVRGASGAITIDLDNLRIALDRGEAAGLAVSDGSVLISGLNGANQVLDMELLVAGPVQAAMGLIASPPLEYPQRIDVRPEQTSGETTTRLRMRFPLLDDLDEDEMEVDATVALTNFGVTNIVDGVDVTDGQARLHVGGSGLRAEGRLAVAGVPGALQLTTSFVDGVDPQAAGQFVATSVPVGRVRSELSDAFDVDGYLVGGTFDGRVGFEASSDGSGIINASLDLARASLAIPEIGWHKPAGAAGVADAIIRTQDDHLAGASELALLAPGLDVGGILRATSQGTTETIEIHRLIAGKTNVTGMIGRDDGRWDIELSGIALDLSPVLAFGEGADGAVASAGQPTFDELPDFSLTADLETLWLDTPDPVRALQATVVHDSGQWMLVQMQGKLADGSIIELSITPDDEGGRLLHAEAQNAGEALRAFGILSDVRGGALEAKGRFDDTDPAHPLKGRVKVRGFHVVNAPILARLLSIMALGGIRDALTGRGIPFSTFDMPFNLREENLEITDGRAFGWSLGITFGGRVNTGTEIVDVTGRLVPFYAINNVLGRLPLVGPIMTGGDRGGGVFSAGYRVAGPLSDPNVSVNPASVLFPGFLRWLLEALSDWMGRGAADVDAALLPP
jgi:hypothetical protein